MSRITAKEARETADNSGWLLDDALARISDAAKHNGAYVRIDVLGKSSEAIRKTEESLRYLGYSVLITHIANDPDEGEVGMEIRW